MLATPARIRTLPAAVVMLGMAAAAWVALVAGAGHTTHHHVFGSGHLPQPAAIAALLAGWQLMIAAMMLPPELASPAGLGNRRNHRQWAEAGALVATTCAVWTGFGIAALAGNTLIHAMTSTWPPLQDLVAPILLVGAGTFHLSALREHLLAEVRRPTDTPWRHALFGLGTCSALMLVTFALSIGSLPAMALMTAAMTAERAAKPRLQPLTGPLIGWALIAAGALLAIRPDMIG